MTDPAQQKPLNVEAAFKIETGAESIVDTGVLVLRFEGDLKQIVTFEDRELGPGQNAFQRRTQMVDVLIAMATEAYNQVIHRGQVALRQAGPREHFIGETINIKPPLTVLQSENFGLREQVADLERRLADRTARLDELRMILAPPQLDLRSQIDTTPRS